MDIVCTLVITSIVLLLQASTIFVQTMSEIMGDANVTARSAPSHQEAPVQLMAPISLTTPTATGTGTSVAKAEESDKESEVDKNGATHSLPPSHILEDGRFIYLPPPNTVERSRFFERSIARHGLLQADMKLKSVLSQEQAKKDDDDAEEEQDADGDEDDKTAPKVHPLAVASARLQANGLSELNRAINLSQLVTTGEYFGLTNIVDPSLEGNAAGETKEGAPSVVITAASQQIDAIKSTFVLKRKRAQFQKASSTLERHEKRLKAAIQAQRVLDRRLFQLRQQWRLVAPEHGTRARLHAARSTEVVAIDVDVYDRDRVGGGNQALKANIGKQQTLAGRLASRVPRFATIELQDDYKVPQQTKDEKFAENSSNNSKTEGAPEEMQTDEAEKEEDLSNYTRAEPFAVADPTLGRVVENFDPTKVPMLNLQLEIQKSSTGFLQSSCLEPITTLRVAKGDTTEYSQDEDLLVSLQHSLFCASLFESIRTELDPQPEDPTQFSATQRSLPPVAWLSCESEQNFLPAPNRVVGGGYGLSSLCVVHCHEGEVKVQLDSEYTLCVKLVEANVAKEKKSSNLDDSSAMDTSEDRSRSGSQSPEQLHALCRALLLHAQDVYHRHSLYLRERAIKKAEEEKAKGDGPRGLARISKEAIAEKARILQSCVSLGSKVLYEQRIRKALVRIARWLMRQTSSDRLDVEWLALSVFDLQSHFTLRFQQLVLDVTIVRDSMTVTQIAEGGEHRKVHFHSEKEFEIFLKMELRRHLRTGAAGKE